jgi:AraC family transcriptional regulator
MKRLAIVAWWDLEASKHDKHQLPHATFTHPKEDIAMLFDKGSRTITTAMTKAYDANSSAVPFQDTKINPEYYGPELIVAEDCWRDPIQSTATRSTLTERVLVSRWTRPSIGGIEHISHGTGDRHTIGINLKSTALTYQSGKMFYDGKVTPGAVHVTSPGESSTVVFHSPCDVLHLYVPQQLLAQHYHEAFDRAHNGDIILDTPQITCDASIQRLGHALSTVQGDEKVFGGIYVESISTAIVARLLERHFAKKNVHCSGGVKALPRWRLRRAIDYIEAHLAEPLTLNCVAVSVGLTRMHFAAQFRLATGFTPHAYLLRRRIEHAQRLLLESHWPIAQISLECGFSTSSHFSEAFKRIIGDSPTCWRARSRAG